MGEVDGIESFSKYDILRQKKYRIFNNQKKKKTGCSPACLLISKEGLLVDPHAEEPFLTTKLKALEQHYTRKITTPLAISSVL